MTVIECRELSKIYGKTTALNHLSFVIKKNTITGLIGRNGAGKTTLLKIIAGFIKETSGEVQVFQHTPFDNLKISANTIFVDDQMYLPTTLNLGEIFEVSGGFYENWNKELAERLFAYFSFDLKQRHNSLSKGKRSTFNMIIGLASRCALTIFDEPTTGMDAAVRKDFYRALLKDYLAYPRTILLSSHLLNEIEDLLEDVLLIKEGEKCLHTSIENLKEYAVGISGKTDLVEEWVNNKETLFKKFVGAEHCYVVVKNEFTDSDYNFAKSNGLELASVPSDDVCVYLTSNTKGGIDDVFN
jgi:ABC-2 type transport system ATP-binding protein